MDIAISSIDFLTLREKLRLHENLSSAEDLCFLSKDDISSIVGRKIRASSWDGRRCLDFARRSFAIVERFGIKAIRFSDPEYPAMLSGIFDPPYMIFVRGKVDCLNQKCVSIVGTRRICRESAEATFKFSADCASNGMTVVSGLAYGVDTFAHRGALSVEGGLTAAVLPCGIDMVAPKGNTKLASGILESGGVLLSEYLPGLGAEAWRCVKRNRLVAALSSVTVVTQAPPGSGALITADFALGYDRYLMFHESCFCQDAKNLTEQSVGLLRAKNTRGSLEKIEHSCENYVRDGAAVFKNFEGFCLALDSDRVPLRKENIQPELAF